MQYWDDELCHHGILGMRWGKRNGPPYPLNASDHSSSEKKAGWRKSLDNKSTTGDNPHKKIHLSDDQKKAIKTGMKIAAVALAAYGAYKIANSNEAKHLVSIGKKQLNSITSNAKVGDVSFNEFKPDEILGSDEKVSLVENGIKKLAKSESISDTIAAVNPHYGKAEYANNCSACGVASFLRQSGYDVIAKGTGGKQQILGGVIDECFKGAKIVDGSAVKFGRSRDDAAEMLVKKFGQNASGVVAVQWKNGRGGHVFNWTIKDGVAEFFDGQANGDDSRVAMYWKMIDPNDALTIARLDDAQIDFEGIKKYVENR